MSYFPKISIPSLGQNPLTKPPIFSRTKNEVRSLCTYCIVFIHFYSASDSIILSEALPTTAIDTVGVYTPKRYRQLQVQDLPKVPTWRLERDSKPSTLRSSGVVSTNAPPLK